MLHYVLQLIANTGGVPHLVSVMRQHAGSDSIICNGCLALMSLVRGEGEVCQSNQWHVAKAGAIEVIAQAMHHFRWVLGVSACGDHCAGVDLPAALRQAYPHHGLIRKPTVQILQVGCHCTAQYALTCKNA